MPADDDVWKLRGEKMERLTKMNEKKTAHFYPQCFEKCGGVGCSEKCDSCGLPVRVCNKLGEYEDLEEQGKLLKLPCANWAEIVFGNQEVFWGIDMDYIENPIREISVDSSERITWYGGWETVVLRGADENGLDWEFLPEEIGKTVFLTREEDEDALKNMD